MSAILTAVVAIVASSFLLPRAGYLVTRYATSFVGRAIGAWAVVALLYDLFATGDRQFNLQDAAITGAVGVGLAVVL